MRAREHRIATIRRARYYALGEEGAAEVWIVAHGFSQLASGFVRYFQTIARPDRLIVAPEALNRFYVSPGTTRSRADSRVGATWMTREDREHEIRDYVDYLDAVHARVARGAERVVALGFSQGVATLARWVTLGTSRVHRLVAWAGQIPPELDLQRLRDRVEAVVLVVGDRDEHASWIDRAECVARLTGAGIPVESITFEGGHRLDANALRRVAGDAVRGR